MLTRAIALCALTLSAILCSACVWTSQNPLVDGQLAMKRPIPAGTYQQGALGQAFPSGSKYVVGYLSDVVPSVTRNDQTYKAAFFPLEDGYILVGVVSDSSSGWIYRMIRPLPNGFEEINLSCVEGEDKELAIAAGASISEDADEVCIFHSRDELQRAAHAVVAAVRNGSSNAPFVEEYVRVG